MQFMMTECNIEQLTRIIIRMCTTVGLRLAGMSWLHIWHDMVELDKTSCGNDPYFAIFYWLAGPKILIY